MVHFQHSKLVDFPFQLNQRSEENQSYRIEETRIKPIQLLSIVKSFHYGPHSSELVNF